MWLVLTFPGAEEVAAVGVLGIFGAGDVVDLRLVFPAEGIWRSIGAGIVIGVVEEVTAGLGVIEASIKAGRELSDW